MRKIFIVTAILTIFAGANTQITWNNTGLINELHDFGGSCDYFQQVFKEKGKIRTMCAKYKRDMKSVLAKGEVFDKMKPHKKHMHMYQGKMHTCTAQKASHDHNTKAEDRYYLDEIRDLVAEKERIVRYANREKTKARKSYDVAYHEKLIRDGSIDLFDIDYHFMDQHKEVYVKTDNKRYKNLLNSKTKQAELKNYLEELNEAETE